MGRRWGLAAIVAVLLVPIGVALARDGGSRGEAIEAHVRCIGRAGPPYGRLRLSRTQAVAAARRLVLHEARSRRSRLGHLVAGRHFTLGGAGTLEQEPPLLVGAIFVLRFDRRSHISGLLPTTGWAPKSAERRYNRRWGYMLYLRRGEGRVRALDVDVDVRRRRIVDINASLNDALDRWDPVPGPCPLLKQTGGED